MRRGDSVSSVVLEAIRRLEEQGIIVGLVSGRTLPMLESLALSNFKVRLEKTSCFAYVHL